MYGAANYFNGAAGSNGAASYFFLSVAPLDLHCIHSTPDPGHMTDATVSFLINI